MGLVKTRRLASMYKQQRAIHLRQGYGGLKATMKMPMKSDAGKGDVAFWLRDGRKDKV